MVRDRRRCSNVDASLIPPKSVEAGASTEHSPLSDGNRGEMLEPFELDPASSGELARRTGIFLPGVLKHARVLEEARLVASVGPDGMDDAYRWIETRRVVWERRMDRLEAICQGWKGERR
jgi:hypothetical protein